MDPSAQSRFDTRDDVLALVRELPKVELHVHVEGTLEAELMLRLARRNGVSTRFRDVADVRRALAFDNLQSFLDLYYEQTQVLQTRQDFFDLTAAYLHRVHRDRVQHTEVFFDPQSHTSRGIAFDVVVDGISAALTEVGHDLGISSRLIMCFLRHRSEAEAFDMLERARAHRDTIHGVGLDSAEVGNPPSKFSRVFAAARRHGFWTVAHAGEEGPPDYIWQALSLGVRRIDHGVRCMEDEALVERLVQDRMPLTVCPVSNVRLKVVPDLAHHNLGRMLERGLVATVNSDDPAYFGGYLGDVFAETVQALGLGRAEVVQLAENAVRAAVLDADRRRELLTQVRCGPSVPRAAGQGT